LFFNKEENKFYTIVGERLSMDWLRKEMPAQVVFLQERKRWKKSPVSFFFSFSFKAEIEKEYFPYKIS